MAVDYGAFNDWADDLPGPLVEDDMFMGFAEQLWDTELRGDHWHAMHDALEDYLWDEYELALDDYIDWDDYGEWYDSTH